jgi:predicted RNase H-like HicB family nuclease
MARTFQVIDDDIVFQFEEADEGGYVVSMPDLPGCVSEGDTFEEALEMIKDAMSGWLLVAQEHGDPFPEKYQRVLRSLSVRR